MTYTVHQVSKISGVTIRTLHYYDEIGLLKPTRVMGNGYRVYEEKDLITLQQILFYKELEFSLVDIKKIINASDFNIKDALEDQQKLLEIKKKRLEKLIQTIETSKELYKGGEIMNTDDLFVSFGDEELIEYQKEAKQRWGNTDAYKQSMEKVKNWTKEDYKRIQEEGNTLTQELAHAMDFEITSEKVQSLIKKHYNGISYYYNCSLEMYKNLGEMYVTDPRFTAYYENFRVGLAQFINDAIIYYCETNKK